MNMYVGPNPEPVPMVDEATKHFEDFGDLDDYVFVPQPSNPSVVVDPKVDASGLKTNGFNLTATLKVATGELIDRFLVKPADGSRREIGAVEYFHELKSDPEAFGAVWDGKKRAEVRYDDRKYKVGHTLLIRETAYNWRQMKIDGQPLVYTGRSVYARITHIQRGYDLPDGIVVLSFIETQRLPMNWTADARL